MLAGWVLSLPQKTFCTTDLMSTSCSSSLADLHSCGWNVTVTWAVQQWESLAEFMDLKTKSTEQLSSEQLNPKSKAAHTHTKKTQNPFINPKACCCCTLQFRLTMQKCYEYLPRGCHTVFRMVFNIIPAWFEVMLHLKSTMFWQKAVIGKWKPAIFPVVGDV